MGSKQRNMMAFWTERAKLYGTDAKTNTNDIWLREIEIKCVDNIIKSYKLRNILDFGCANGYSTVRLAKNNPRAKFSGFDINSDMIELARVLASKEKCPNVNFRQRNIFKDDFMQHYDFIYTIRLFQNLQSLEMQKKVFDRIYKLLKPRGLFYYIESYMDGYKQLNNDRLKMDLPLLPIHKHLTLLSKRFDNYVSRRMELLERQYPSSSYYLITRLLYSYLAKMNKEPIDYNHPIHQIAALVPQVGAYGPQRAFLFRKRK